MRGNRWITIITLVLVLVWGVFIQPHLGGGQPAQTPVSPAPISDAATEISVSEDGEYTDAEHVALYIHTYGRLPGNYVTKAEAEKAGWDSREGNLHLVLPGKSIGGDRNGNYEGHLPKAAGRTYKECDIDYESGTRNAKRLVWSSDGLIFYTQDHYNSFVQLY